MEEVKTIKVACAIVKHNNKILVTQRSESMNLPLKWEFPGGKIEKNETAADCVMREIKEELNITIQTNGFMKEQIHDYGTFVIALQPVLADYLGGTIQLHEHANFLWLSPDELGSVDWAAADKAIVSELMNG